MSDAALAAESGTVASDYGGCYYNDAHLGGYDNYTWDNEQWRGFFQLVADRIIALAGRGRILDVGCARGLLVQALREKGADAEGFDISEHAIESAHADVREHLSVRSATEPIDKRYDLVTLIEVIEHLAPGDAQKALDQITKATDRILFSSSPGDHDEPTHINTKPTATWAAWMAERGFFRRTDVDLTFLSPWAVLFERADKSVRDVVQHYEQHLAALNSEVLEKRASLLAAHRNISELRDREPASELAAEREAQLATQLAEQVKLVKQFEREVLEARHALLINRDHVIGTEAEIGRQNREIVRLNGDLRRALKRIANLTQRKQAQRKRIATLRGKLTAAQRRAQNLQRRVRDLENRPQPQPSVARKVVRRLRGAGR